MHNKIKREIFTREKSKAPFNQKILEKSSQFFNIPSLRFNVFRFNHFIHLSSPSNHVYASAHKPFLRLFNPHYLNVHKFHQLTYPISCAVISSLNSCISLQILKQFHASVIVSNGHDPSLELASKLTSLYIQFNDFGSSVSVLKAMKEPNTFLWNSVIKAHVKSGLIESAFSVFKLMRRKGVSCDSYTFPILTKLVELENGVCYAEMIHCLAMQMGFESDVYFCNTMIEAYIKTSLFGNALKVFDEMPHRDFVSWTSMISGYVYEGKANGAFRLFNEMRKNVEPNEVTMIVMLQTCSSLAQGWQIHSYVIKAGSLIDQSLKNSILKMYSDFGSTNDSETLFEEITIRDVISWNIMISSYSSEDKTMKMTECFNRMRAEVKPSIETLTLLISNLAECENPYQGTQLHSLALKSGFFDDILKTSLLDLYAKSHNFENAFELFKQTVATAVKPVIEHTRIIVVICTHIGALRLGKSLHGYSIKNFFFDSNENVRLLETSILNMYIRCGNISYARIWFDKLHPKDLVTWSSMIEGYGTHGLGHEALNVFNQMQNEGIEPNNVTFLSLLSACSHSGLVLEGYEALNSMKRDFNIEPDLDHYTCVVDLLGRSGMVKEALTFILKLVALPDSRIWGALLAASRVHEDRKVGEYAVKRVLETENDNSGYYTIFSNVEARMERWDEVEDVRNGMKDMNLMKIPGWSCLEVGGKFHGFVSWDRSHWEMDEICRVVECLSRNAIDL